MILPARVILSLLVVAGGVVDLGLSFQSIVGRQRRLGEFRSFGIGIVKDTLQHHEFFGGGGSDFDTVGTVPSDDAIFKSLTGRQQALSRGIGKRYIARTQKGFLNVHYEV